MGVAAVLACLLGGGSLAATLTPPALNTASESDPFTTRSVTGIPSDGSGSYTYLWSVVDNGGASIAINSPTAATTTFELSAVPVGDYTHAIARLTVTDTATLAWVSVDLPIDHLNIIII